MFCYPLLMGGEDDIVQLAWLARFNSLREPLGRTGHICAFPRFDGARFCIDGTC